MKTFLKVLLIVVAVIVAVKLLPLTLLVASGLVAGIAMLVGFGVSLVALGFGAALTVLAATSPIWIPILALVGLVMLLKRLNEPSA